MDRFDLNLETILCMETHVWGWVLGVDVKMRGYPVFF